MPSARSQDGFTLPELLVVIIIIGVLAAIALPSFVKRIDNGQDADAKSDGAALAGFVDQCGAESDDYTQCDSTTELFGSGSTGGLPYGNGSGDVQVVTATTRTYQVVATSRSGTKFTIDRPATGAQNRTCDQPNKGSCPPSGTW